MNRCVDNLVFGKVRNSVSTFYNKRLFKFNNICNSKLDLINIPNY